MDFSKVDWKMAFKDFLRIYVISIVLGLIFVLIQYIFRMSYTKNDFTLGTPADGVPSGLLLAQQLISLSAIIGLILSILLPILYFKIKKNQAFAKKTLIIYIVVSALIYASSLLLTDSVLYVGPNDIDTTGGLLKYYAARFAFSVNPASELYIINNNLCESDMYLFFMGKLNRCLSFSPTDNKADLLLMVLFIPLSYLFINFANAYVNNKSKKSRAS